jgi:hypothetical protein
MNDQEDLAVTERPKKVGLGLEIKTLRGKSGRAYLVFRTRDSVFHVFSEVDAEESAVDCGAQKGSVEQMWESIWNDLKGKGD